MSSMEYSGAHSGAIGTEIFGMTCWCSRDVRLLTSGSKKNPGRPFFKCVTGLDNHFFKWLDDVLLDEVCNFKTDIPELKSVIEEQNKVIDELKCEVENGRERIRKSEWLGKICFCVMLMVIVYLVTIKTIEKKLFDSY